MRVVAVAVRMLSALRVLAVRAAVALAVTA
jgi:hypothetical protein